MPTRAASIPITTKPSLFTALPTPVTTLDQTRSAETGQLDDGIGSAFGHLDQGIASLQRIKAQLNIQLLHHGSRHSPFRKLRLSPFGSPLKIHAKEGSYVAPPLHEVWAIPSSNCFCCCCSGLITLLLGLRGSSFVIFLRGRTQHAGTPYELC